MKVAIYARVSTDEQTAENQTRILTEWAGRLNAEVFGTYVDVGSAWQNSDQKELRRLVIDCSRRLIDTVLIYDLSRLTRKGPLEMMLAVKRFSDKKVKVMSYIDTWMNNDTGWNDILIPMFGKFAELYSRQLSERTKAGMERAKAQGKHCGRPKGKKDGGKRNKSGYFERWA